MLAGVFLFATLLAWLRAIESGSVRMGWLLLALTWFTLSLLSKAWGITLPAVLLLLDLWPLRRWKRLAPDGRGLGALLIEKIPFAVLATIVAVLAFNAQKAGAGGETAVVGLDQHGIAQRLMQAAYGTMFYVRKTLWPVGLAPLYELEREFDPTRLRYLVSAVAFALTSLLTYLLRRRHPALPVAWLTFLVVVSPSSVYCKVVPKSQPTATPIWRACRSPDSLPRRW